MSDQNDVNIFEQGSNVVIPRDIEKEMRESYLEYSMSVIVERALPDVRDGLKPVHRRIIYKVHEMGLTPERAYRKCADIVGNVLGSYHPHGDASVYDALVRMAQDFSLRYPLVDGHGNFGSVDGDPPAAYRYTEARMAKISRLMVSDIESETVDMKPNYDDRLLEPKVLPARFPNLLVNGSSGIAVGMATNIPPHSMRETIGAVNYLIDNPDAELPDLMEYIKGPDFPTGGIIMGHSGIRAAYATGRGKITLRGRAEITEVKGKNIILITEIPYMVNKARLLENIAELVNAKKIDGISTLRDESSNRTGMRIVIELKRDANAQIVLNHLYRQTQLQTSVGVIMLALENGIRPKVMNLKEILTQYIDFQKEIIIRRTTYLLNKAKKRAHILEALKTALDFIDEVISIIRSSKTIPESKERLAERFGFDDIQTSAIVAMRLGQLSGLEKDKILGELEEITQEVAEYESILVSDEKIFGIIKDEGTEILNKYSDERRTEIQSVSGEVDIEDLIPVEDCAITLTHFGYIKRQPVDVYRTQKRGGRGVSGMTRRDEDFVEELFVSSSHDHILFFTNFGRIFRIKCYEIPESSRVSRGTNIVNILALEENEQVQTMIKVEDMNADMFITMVTKNGIIKRVALSEFHYASKRGVRAITLMEDDSLAFVKLTNGARELIVATRNGMAIRFPEQDVRCMGRTARGVKAIRLDEDDYVIGMARARNGGKLLTVTDKGLGRRCELDEYRLQSRGGKGIINYKVNDKKGYVIGAQVVDDDDDIMMIASDGVIIRIHASDIQVYSRTSGGVKLMRADEDASIVSFARAPREETDDSTDDNNNEQAENTQNNQNINDNQNVDNNTTAQEKNTNQ